jgi:hypothetical protein
MSEEKKKWYKSKTFWVNVIAFSAMLAQTYYGFLIAPEEQAAIIVVANLVLRAVTKEGLEL